MKSIAFRLSKEVEVARPLFDHFSRSPASIRLPRTREVFQIEDGPVFSDYVSVILSMICEWDYKLLKVSFSGCSKIHFAWTGHYIAMPKSINQHNYMNHQVWLSLWDKYGPR